MDPRDISADALARPRVETARVRPRTEAVRCGPMSSRRELVRSHQWWGHKIPPVLGVSAIAINLGGVTGRDLLDLALLLIAMIGLAAFGHVVNDLSDIEADARGGKGNVTAHLSTADRGRLVVGSLVLGLAPWWWLPDRPAARAAMLVELALLLAYSVPPVRLKARGWLGALADAAYAYAVPFVLVGILFGPRSGGSRHDVLIALLGVWGLLVGLRGILWHQIGDLSADRAAGIETAAARLGVDRTEALVGSLLLPAEIASGIALAVVAGIAWLQWLLAFFVGWRCLQLSMLWEPPIEWARLRRRSGRVEILGFAFANEFIERWLPAAALVALALDSPWWWVAVVLHLAAFPSAVRSFLAHDVWLIPDALERLALSWGLRGEIRQVAQRRAARVRNGPADDQPRGRFVFVVCGPVEHLDTLGTAIRHLRPVTKAEIWVVTDTHRNARPMDAEGTDHVVDVATPRELDDHQASIWLKTSVHRHVPDGEWCYLDSDIIAAAPGVEGVFDERRGPVAFASDVTIRENSVDRFSPWAMTCDCVGYGDQHSCAHLREQLTERFALDVPGDWLHWNGGVFVFGADSAPFLDLWHERAVASFGWPEWKTRDQGTLIATAWTLGLQDLPRISPEFNFIADLGNYDLCLDLDRGWAHHPSGPWYDPKLLHLYTSPLEDPAWRLGPDVESVIMRRSRVRVYRWERSVVAARVKLRLHDQKSRLHERVRVRLVHWTWELRRFSHWAKCFFDPRRLSPYRVNRGIRERLGMDVSHLPHPLDPERRGSPPPEADGQTSAPTDRRSAR